MNPLVPFSRDPLAITATRLLDHYRDQLPDLSHCHILVPDTQCAPQLRAELLRQAAEHGCQALLGPTIERLDDWLTAFAADVPRVLDRPAQELVLTEALRHAGPLYADTDPWLLADQLLTLFDELTRNRVPIAADADAFTRRLAHSYGIEQPSPSLQQEAYILHTLWHAWRQQLAAEQCTDPASAYVQQLDASLAAAPAHDLWLLGFSRLSVAEAQWLTTRLERGQTTLLLHGQAQHPDNHPDAPLKRLLEQLALPTAPATDTDSPPFSQFIETLLAPDGDDLRQRARQFAQHHPDDPLAGRLHSLCADSPEQEAQAVALQVRRWLLDGARAVAVVTTDRKLARRVRALLETAGIVLDDPGGWALSTTSAAATLERWLETVEEDFPCGPLLDVLKSPFIGADARETHLAHVRRLEQDIILHENIARGLQRYRRHLDLRSERLPDWSENNRRAVHALLNRIDHAASSLLPLLEAQHPVGDYLEALDESLEELGLPATLAADDAGRQVLELLQRLHQAAAGSSAHLDWQGFRNWLGRNLERATFRVPLSGSPVRLLTLEQTRLQHFDGVVIAGCSAEQLPGAAPAQTFFNQRVRAQLGLPTGSDKQALQLYDFCRVLHSGEQLLLTRHRDNDGEPVAISPWLALLETFHANAYGTDLSDTVLHQLLQSPAAQPATPDQAALPTVMQRPAPQAPATLLPRSWSAYTHQRLIDCPYRFFAADTLSLKPQEDIREALSKSDYGSLIHRVLQAFHSDIDGLPGPWSGALTAADRDAAQALLRAISQAVFGAAIRDNFQARSWLHQWLSAVPAYLDWLIQRQRDWQLRAVEYKTEHAIGTQLRLKGRIDRVDQRDGRLAIVDYKTGKPPGGDDVLRGEAVQLPTYALSLAAPVEQLDYVELGRDSVKPTTCAQGAELQALLQHIEQRLVTVDAALQQRAPLPAWGDDKVCAYCEFSGLCRRDGWTPDTTP